MPARVPIGNSSEGMFDNANSIEQAVIDKYGSVSGESLQAILDKVNGAGNIEDFHPSFRPASLGAINSFDQFQGFPISGKILWYMQEKDSSFIPV